MSSSRRTPCGCDTALGIAGKVCFLFVCYFTRDNKADQVWSSLFLVFVDFLASERVADVQRDFNKIDKNRLRMFVSRRSKLFSIVSGVAKVSLFFFFLFVFLSFFFTKFQTPVTLSISESWSILVVRPAHSADLRSRLRHVSSAPSVAYSTGCSRVVTHPGTNPARQCFCTSEAHLLVKKSINTTVMRVQRKIRLEIFHCFGQL